MAHAANQGLRPTITGLQRRVCDSAQILLATPSPRFSLASIEAWLQSLCSLAEMLGSKVDPFSPDRLAA